MPKMSAVLCLYAVSHRCGRDDVSDEAMCYVQWNI